MFIARTENRLCDTKICWALYRFLHSNPDEKKNIFDLSKCCYSASDPPHCLKVFVIHIAWKLFTWKSKTGCCCCCCVTVRYYWIGNSVLLCDRIEVPKWYRTGTISITNKGSVVRNFTATFNRLNLIWPYNSNVGVKWRTHKYCRTSKTFVFEA